MKKLCAYCGVNESSNSEHVFPYSLGGENLFMDCVCDICNNKFSTLERELLQKSMIGILRSVEGIEGYSKGKFRIAPLKYPQIFQFVKEDKAVYEIGLYQGFKPFMRPQIIQIDKIFYAEGPSIDEMKVFTDKFNLWRKSNLKMIVQFPKEKGDLYKAVKYEFKNERFEIDEVEIKNDKKALIHYNLIHEKSGYYEYFEPRLFLDDSGRLIVRSKSVAEGKKFIKSLLIYCKTGASKFASFSEKKTKEPIRVSMEFDVVKMHQALVKIALNCLMYYYPATNYDILLNPAKEFVLNETPIKSAIDKKIDLIDTDSKFHTILFYQFNEGLLLRTSLFGGSFVYSFLIENLNLFKKEGMFSAVEIDFKNRCQIHLQMNEYLLTKIVGKV